jgi:mono/diheme cytochrome c family protein
MTSLRKRLAITALSASLFATAAMFLSSPAVVGNWASQGQTVYGAKCAICHAPDGSGNTATGKKLGVRDLRSAQVQGLSDAQLVTLVAKGKGKMPAYEKGLSRQQIEQVVAFVRELGKRR